MIRSKSRPDVILLCRCLRLIGVEDHGVGKWRIHVHLDREFQGLWKEVRINTLQAKIVVLALFKLAVLRLMRDESGIEWVELQKKLVRYLHEVFQRGYEQPGSCSSQPKVHMMCHRRARRHFGQATSGLFQSAAHCPRRWEGGWRLKTCHNTY